MIEIQGKHNRAKIFTDNVDEVTMAQILDLCNQGFTEGSQIRIMPDTHAGKGCTIGTTMTIQDKVVPNLVGVDIGCGMNVTIVDAHKDDINFDKLNDTILATVPSGRNIRGNRHELVGKVKFGEIIAPYTKDRAELSLGTLGGGNHFIEMNELADGKTMLVIHSGSRNLGKELATYYQNKAYDELMTYRKEIQELINKLKREGRHKEIQTEINRFKERNAHKNISKDMAYLQGDYMANYLHDVKIAQEYALLNRTAMASEIVKGMGFNVVDKFDTIHNYISVDEMILRKGAISAREGERVLVPINMRDGSIIAYGRGNEDWNYSAPHGAGRVLSRSKAKEQITLEEFQDSMKNVWTKSVGVSTLDESPMAYKSLNDILDNVLGTLDVQEVAPPIYNFKASE